MYSWDDFLKEEQNKLYYKDMWDKVCFAYDNNVCFPPFEDIFNAFKLCSFDDCKVVIIGQDPYINENQANGLAFSINQGFPLSPSLRNIYKELYDDLGVTRLSSDLSDWAVQGVLLLNRILSVSSHESLSHQNFNWQEFTNNVIRYLNNKEHCVVYLLWGKKAQEIIPLIDLDKHFVLCADHPSPLSAYRGFFGCRCFSNVNYLLVENGIEPIVW
ncbi:MAG: uracil-DNA glycosylase [Erysipelotrichaceae bacterium]